MLIGMHGVGKSTLALIASRALGFRFVDTDHHVQTALGMAPFKYIKEHSLSAYRTIEYEVISDLLRRSSERSVIACGAAAIEYPPNCELLAEFSKSHPVIHIVGDEDRIAQYLNAPDPAVVYSMCRSRYPLFRDYANFEFFNLTAQRRSRSDPKVGPRPSLMLKNSELDFLRYLELIVRHEQDEAASVKVPHPEHRPYTYSISLRFPPPQAVHSGLDDYIDDYVESSSIADRVVGADCVEVVVDVPLLRSRSLEFASVAKFVGIIRRQTRLPVIFSISSDSDLSDSNSLAFYFTLLEYGLRLATSYVNIDLTQFIDRTVTGDHQVSYQCSPNTQKLITYLSEKSPIPFANNTRILSENRSKYNRQIIGSWHHSHAPSLETVNWWDSDEPRLIVESVLKFCGIIRLSKEAESFYDNQAVFAFHHRNNRDIREAGACLSAYNIGPMGRVSRIFNQFFTPVIAQYSTNLSLFDHSPLQSHDISAYDAQLALYSSCALPKLQFYLFGGAQCITALSPTVMNAGFRALGIPHTHSTYESTDPNDMFTLIARPEFGGITVTNPHKISAMRIADTISEQARVIGAVNTLIPERAHDNMQITAIRGENTDWIGFYNCILAHLTPVNSVSKKTTALVIGSGGSARAMIYALIQLGVENIIIYDRKRENTSQLAEHFNSISPLQMTSVSATNHVLNSNPTPNGRESTTRPREFKLHVLDALDNIIAVSMMKLEMPTIIVSAVSAYVEFPVLWFARSTGGVYLEVRANSFYLLLFTFIYCKLIG